MTANTAASTITAPTITRTLLRTPDVRAPVRSGSTAFAANSRAMRISAASERSRLSANDGWSVRGTFQIVFIASWLAWAAPIPAQIAPTMPMTSANGCR